MFSRACLTALALACFAPTVRAQTPYVWLGGAATMPIGDSKNALKTGWLLDVGYGHPIAGSKKLSFQIGGLYGSNSSKFGGTGKNSLLGGMANLSLGTSSDKKMGGYFYAGGGVLQLKSEGASGDTKGAFQVGGGVTRTISMGSIWAEVRYLASGSSPTKLTLLPITVGITKNLGGKK